MNIPLIKSKYAFPAFVAVGVVLAFLTVSFAPSVKHVDVGAPAPIAEYIEAKKRTFVPRATGYGFAEPSTILEAGAEVSGRITFMNDELKAGALLPEGTVVLRIDPTDYELSLAEARADLAAARAQKKEQELLFDSAQTAFKIADRNLKLGVDNLERKRGLLTNGTISQASLDQEEQRVLQLRQDKQTRQQQLETLPSQIEVAAARIKQNEARVVEQEERLARTTIRLPFTARIAAVHVDAEEYINLGGKLFDAHSVDAVEITTRLSIGSLQNLVAGMQQQHLKDETLSPGNLLQMLGVTAEVVLPDRVYDARWDAKVMRIGESQDMETRTLAMVVRVEDPYGQIVAGKRPPLLKGMYVTVNLMSHSIDALVVPRHAVHDGKLYVANMDGTLSLRNVDVVTQDDIAVVRTGLNDGERVIVTDLIPAVDGMKVEAVPSEEAETELNAVSAALRSEASK
jgi:RND family efflux transporter MFP subunit